FIIHGTKLTLGLTLLVVAGRFLLALPMGLAAGFGSQAATALTNLFSALFTTIPALIISIIVLKMNFFLSLDKAHSILAFVIVLTIVGWGKLAVVIRERVGDIVSTPFFRGEIAIGKGPLRLAVENVLPHLASELVVLFFMEIAAALTILMQLGVFAVFIGNLRLIESADGGKLTQLRVSFEPEWASMLATSRNFLRTAPWMVLAPASAFFVTILGFNLFGEGLKRPLLKRDAKFPVYVRAALSLNWQRLAKGAMERPGFKALTAVLILFVLIFPVLNFGRAAKPSFNLSEAASALSYNQEQIIIGTEEAKQTAEDIAKAFGELGLTPLSQGFINEYPIDDLFIPKAADLKATGKNGETKTFVYDRDYTVTSFGEFALEGKIYNAREEDLYSGKNYPYFTNKFVLFDSSYYSLKAVESLVEKIMTESKAQGVLVVGRKGLPLPVSLGKKAYKGPVVWISPDAADYLTSVPENTLKVSLKSRQLESKGRNVIGVLPGLDKNLKKETVVIGLCYNYRAGEQGGREKVLLGLELVKKLASQKEMRTRNIVVAFWD
ncbi:MAG TPA: hypothetical protein VNU93_04420, partial [Verrucomicrobiae bacterium]|nr:hypothetical protein [Verrucomicrobiae bacterium]